MSISVPHLGKQPRFLITGGAGFIGSHLSERLLKMGYHVSAIDDLSTGSLDNLSEIMNHPHFRFARADVMNSSVLDRLASEAEIIVHLAAAVGVQLIVENPVRTIETNIGGTESVLKVALRYGCKTLIASTSEVYGKGLKVPFSEEDDVLLGTTDKSRWAYAASKMIDEFLGLAYVREFNLDVVPFRLFNTVGVRQTGRYGMVIPRFVQHALKGEPIHVYGDGTQTRCFCDVVDVVEALIGLALSPESKGILFNIGGTEEISMLDLAQKIKAMTGSSSEIVLVPYDKAYPKGFEDMQRRVPDTSRINQAIGWRPTRDLNELLAGIIAYEQRKMKQRPAEIITRSHHPERHPQHSLSALGDPSRTYVIAEIGKNFIQTELDQPVSTYLENAKALARAAKDAGADAVKFQTHIVEDEQLDVHVVSPHFSQKDRYSWVARNESATPREGFWVPLKEFCDSIGITFFSTPMSRKAAQLLSSLDVPLWKVGSGDVLDFVCLDYLAQTQRPIILSTGMSTKEELDLAIDFLNRRNVKPYLVHCVSRYPCPLEALNLSTISFLSQRYGIPVGFSDHSLGDEGTLFAVALGARIIEKHFSFDRALWGSDHKVSLLPAEFASMVAKIRELERSPKRTEILQSDAAKRSFGVSGKILQEDEAAFRGLFRKSLVAARDIAAGEIVTPDMVYAMRPQLQINGLTSEQYEKVIGRRAQTGISKYSGLQESLFTQKMAFENAAR